MDEDVERQKKDCHHHVSHGQVYEKIVERNPVEYQKAGMVPVLMHEFCNVQHYIVLDLTVN